ncbi:DUF4345 domain-containing protein [uncultured Lacinutrix sp.]|uniref:DUF4345 domain-containing protein n=1 Tax=uncultured Lacinutrix sp. TaxID=574032 RepID=UPI0026327A5C|nr:DUF4345 domain-containing protein [uncultured Lacinutrix sp.]
MIQSQNDFINKIHLIISIIIVVLVAFIYGFRPDLSFDMFLETTDEKNFYKAIMGLYLGFSFLWLLGIIKAQYFKIAILTNIIFMLGLGFGRIVSILIDGIPTFGYVFGTVAELFLGCYGLWVLKRLIASDQCSANSKTNK